MKKRVRIGKKRQRQGYESQEKGPIKAPVLLQGSAVHTVESHSHLQGLHSTQPLGQTQKKEFPGKAVCPSSFVQTSRCSKASSAKVSSLGNTKDPRSRADSSGASAQQHSHFYSAGQKLKHSFRLLTLRLTLEFLTFPKLPLPPHNSRLELRPSVASTPELHC